jgi:hypothetical protein
MSVFKSREEFREVMDRTFALMSEDPEIGPRLREADTPQRFEFTDFEMVVNIRPGADNEPNLAWEWSDDVNWEPTVRMTMSSETILPRQVKGRDRDRAPADQGRRRCQGGARDHPDHQATVRALPADDRRRLPASRGLTVCPRFQANQMSPEALTDGRATGRPKGTSKATGRNVGALPGLTGSGLRGAAGNETSAYGRRSGP